MCRPGPRCCGPVRERGGEAGYTLIELLVVLAVIGLLTAVAVPMFANAIPGTELRATARDLGADMRLARSRAIAGNREVVLAVDLVGRRYSISDDGKTHAIPKELDIKVLTARSEIGGSEDQPRSASIRFFPDGTSTGGRISLARGERSYHVGVDWLTGRVTVVDGNDVD